MKRIIIKTEKAELSAELNESNTAKLIFESLPIKGKVNLWGEEIYFEIPLKLPAENAVTVVKKGDVAYWPEGHCFCIFFGKTPISTDEEIRPASAVNLVGRLVSDSKELKKVKSGEEIVINVSPLP